MGTSYSAIAVVGVRVDPRLLLDRRQVPACKHNPPETATFCPTCGKPAREESIVPKPFCDTNYPEEGLSEVKSVAGLPLFLGTWDERTGLPAEAFVGFGACTHDDEEGSRFCPPVDLRERIKAALEPLGLWDESEYGIWAVLRCSY